MDFSPWGPAQGARQGKPGVLSLFTPLFDYLYCLLASIALVSQPLPGGALFMVAQLAGLAPQMLRDHGLGALPRAYRRIGLALLILSALISAGLLLIYPLAVELPYLWVVFVLVLISRLRSFAARRLSRSMLRRGLSRAQCALRQAELVLLFGLLLAPFLFLSQPADTAWYLLGGFLFSASIEGYALLSRPAAPAFPHRESLPDEAQDSLASINAYRVFRRVLAITVAGVQVSLIISFTFIGTTAGDVLLCMGLALAFAFLASRVAHWVLVSFHRARRDPSNLLLAGLLLWVIGLVSLGLRATRPEAVWSYLAIGLSTAGTTVALTALQALDDNMADLIAFAVGPQEGLHPARLGRLTASYAALAGQMIGLIALSLLLFFGPRQPASWSSLALQPALLLPALALAAAALLSAVRFPMERRHARKLHQFLMLKENGETNLALQRQLEDALVDVSRRHYGIKLLILVLRPMFRSRVLGRENLRLDRDAPCIFVCNHGELYGPIVGNLYAPVPVRSWVIAEMADPELIADYIYTYTVKRQRWLPEWLKMPVSRLVAPILASIMRGIECIPVYRNNPRALISTFRQSSAAMEAGDSLLIFPENPNDPALPQPGYLKDAVGPFYSGFAMAAQLYYRRSGKRAQFFPIYADKKGRTISFGRPTRFDPAAHPNEEYRRISDHLRAEMLRMGARDGSPGAAD